MISIENLVVNISKDNTFWVPVLASLLGAIGGAVSSYFFNRRIEDVKNKKFDTFKFKQLARLAFNLRHDLLSFKEKTFLPIKNEANMLNKAMVQNDFYNKEQVRMLKAIIFSKYEFDENLNSFHFLFDLNERIYFLLAQINKYVRLTNDCINNFNLLSKKMQEQMISFGGVVEIHVQDSISLVYLLEDYSDNLLYLVDLLFHSLKQCPKKEYKKKINDLEFNSCLIFAPGDAFPHILKNWEGVVTSRKK